MSPDSAKSSHARGADFAVPAPVAALLARLPALPGSLLLVTALNAVLIRHLPGDVRQRLAHRRLSIRVRDARVAFDFVWMGSHFEPRPPQAEPDLIVSASAHDFLRLAQRKVDADTLFFSRRLVMEGDTELGLVVKNAMDAIELPVLDPRHWSPRAVLARRTQAARGRA